MPWGSQNRPEAPLQAYKIEAEGDPKSKKIEDEGQSVTPGRSWEGPRRAPEALVVDLGRHFGSPGPARWELWAPFWHPSGILDVTVAYVFPTSIFYCIFLCFFLTLGVDFVVVFRVFFVADSIPLPSMISLLYFLHSGSPSVSEKLRRYAFHTVKPMVFTYLAFSINRFFE